MLLRFKFSNLIAANVFITQRGAPVKPNRTQFIGSLIHLTRLLLNCLSFTPKLLPDYRAQFKKFETSIKSCHIRWDCRLTSNYISERLPFDTSKTGLWSQVVKWKSGKAVEPRRIRLVSLCTVRVRHTKETMQQLNVKVQIVTLYSGYSALINELLVLLENHCDLHKFSNKQIHISLIYMQ
jgi:hypothetical protein